MRFIFFLFLPAWALQAQIPCNVSYTGCPSDGAPLRYLRVNLHFIMNAAGEGNFTEIDDGDGGAYNGYQRAEDIVRTANEQLEQNTAVWGQNPAGPVCAIPFRIVLKGVYFHRTNHALAPGPGIRFYPTQMWSYLANNCMVNPDAEVNCMLFDAPSGSGQANGKHLFIHHSWPNYLNGEKPTLGSDAPNLWPLGMCARTLIHELFHNHGLPSHPYQGDLCDDTPTLSPPCWDWNPDPASPCHSGASNLLMDYNAQLNWSLSACEICRLMQLVQPDFIEQEGGACPPPNAFFDLPERICPFKTNNFPVWMEASASFNETRHRIKMEEISAGGGTTMVFSAEYEGEVGKIDLNAYTGFDFKCQRTYRITLAAGNDCEQWAEQSKNIYIDCFCQGEDTPQQPANPGFSFNIQPNPASGWTTLSYTLETPGTVRIRVHRLLDGNLILPEMSSWQTPGPQSLTLDTSAFPAGWYLVHVVQNTSTTVQLLELSDE
jgi:hypothetical protein